MKHRKKTLLYSLLFTLFFSVILGAMNLESYTVKLESFSGKVYSQNLSHYRLTSESPLFNLRKTPFQKTINKEKQGDSTLITLQSGIITKKPAEKRLQQYLSDTRYLNLKSSSIINQAAIIKRSPDPLYSAENFVHRHIQKKMTGIPLLPASVIMKNREGDCTEHSILLTAILRSAGIPARAVTGMILVKKFAGKKNLFVYHMWVEAFYRKRWVMLDATRPGEKHHNRYIAFCYHNLKTEMPLSYMKTISSIKNFRVFYLK